MRKTGYLVLQNGQLFEGKLFGAQKEVMAEIVFNTSMVGYLCTITDPSYLGEMVVQTFPMIGNYGLIEKDFEAKKPALAAYIVREICEEPSNFRSEGKLEDYLLREGIPGMCDIDTRQLTKLIRDNGVMNAAILHEKPKDLTPVVKALNAMSFHPKIKEVSIKEKCEGTTEGYHVVLMDFGAKKSIQGKMEKKGCKVTCVPCDTKAEDILALKPDGILLSNGPGDPNDNKAIIDEVKKLKASAVPMLGICMGHQLLALSQGGKAHKLTYGHRGANQPVKDLKTGRGYMTAQNHGFTIAVDALPKNAEMSFININDGTCEGLNYTDTPAFSVQFHPEASGGPLDTEFLFDRFIDMMGGKK